MPSGAYCRPRRWIGQREPGGANFRVWDMNTGAIYINKVAASITNLVNWPIYYTPTPPALNGSLSDPAWAVCPPLVMNSPSQLTYQNGQTFGTNVIINCQTNIYTTNADGTLFVPNPANGNGVAITLASGDAIEWFGPDGSSIPAVPHYECETLLSIFTTDAAAVPPEYGPKCLAHGITRPAGMQLQDLGWVAKPRVVWDCVKPVTWREYFDTIAPKTASPWRVTQEDIHATLPWGETKLRQLAQDSRAAEIRLPVAEKMAAMARLWAGAPYPADRLEEAWKHTLDSQHHDAWVIRDTGAARNWGWQLGAQTYVAMQILDQVTRQAAEAMAPTGSESGPQPPGTRGFRVFDETNGEQVSQLDATRLFFTDELIAHIQQRSDVHPNEAEIQALAEKGDAGINAGVLSDHTTGYSHGPNDPLGLVLGWGWKSAVRTWSNCPLTGTQTTRYALVPHAGLWDSAHLWQECQRWHEPLISQLMLNPPPHQPLHASLLRIEGGSLDAPTMVVEGNALIVRLFNAEDGAPAKRLSLG
jgi:hypothetical protein